jgi:hypothetical protein
MSGQDAGMSHADTIRPQIRHAGTVVLGTGAHPSFCKGCAADAALDVLLAENQRLRDALDASHDHIAITIETLTRGDEFEMFGIYKEDTE